MYSSMLSDLKEQQSLFEWVYFITLMCLIIKTTWIYELLTIKF